VKLKLLVVGLLVGLMIIVIGSASTQDAKLCASDFLSVPAPDGHSIQDALVDLMAAMTDSAKAGDIKGWLKQSADLRLILGLMEAECSGRHFSSEGKGLKSLVGPIALPDGIWKASLHTDGMLTSATVTNVKGTCFELIPNLFMVSQTTFDVAQESLLTTSGGCIAMIQIENIGGKQWDLTLEPISLTNP